MALYHLSVKQIKRSAGQSAVAAAAYRAGEKLHSNYYGEDADYTKKGGVVFTEILLPSHAPKEYADRETLWNAVEKIEEHPKAQLAYSFDIALQNEFSMEENISLARQFVEEQFVSRGMIADLAVHTPDKENGENPNPHFHVLCPIRPLNEDGTWGKKQKREYVLDEHGNRIPDGDGDYVFNAVPTTDWGRPETLEHWRKAWARLCNEKFKEKGIGETIDHRSYERQDVDQIPTIHEGPHVRQMEAKGILTERGDLNRWIRQTNRMAAGIRKMLAELTARIKEIAAILTAPQEKTLSQIIRDYYDERNKGAWSRTAKIGNLKSMSEMINLIHSLDIRTVDDLEKRRDRLEAKLDGKQRAVKAAETRMKEISELLRMVDIYTENKAVYDKWYNTKFTVMKNKFKSEHEDEIWQFQMAARKLKPHFRDGKLPITKWHNELDALEQEYDKNKKEINAIKREAQSLTQISITVKKAIEGERKQEQRVQHRRHEHER